MLRPAFLILAFLLVSSEAEARRLLGRWFELVPEEQSHVVVKDTISGVLDPTRISVLVWNIKKSEMKNWAQEFLDYSRQRHLVLLQEGYRNSTFDSTLATIPAFRWDMAVSFLMRQKGRTPTGVLIGSTADPVEVRAEHTRDYEPLVNTPKATLYAKYPLLNSAHELLVVSVHGINLTSFATFKRHVEQMRAEIARHEGPVLWAGDFNTRTQARTRYLMQAVRDLGLSEVNFKNGDRRMVWKFTKNYLDHGFVRGLTVKDAEVIVDSRGSDHRPLTLELALEN
jgi:endonuclease/exonuclease/phosphatase (EEP) superfamily protein YafD